MFWALRFGIFYGGLQSLVAAMAYLTWKEGYFINTAAQALTRGPRIDGKPIGYLIEHAGWIGDVLWVSAVLAFIAATYLAGSDGFLLLALLILGGLIGIPVLEMWTTEGIAVPSGLARDGLLPLAGAVHYLYLDLAMALIVKFYFTPNLRLRDIWIVTGVMMAHVALGVLYPVYHSTGSIPPKTWLLCGLALVCLAALGGGRTWFLHHFGY